MGCVDAYLKNAPNLLTGGKALMFILMEKRAKNILEKLENNFH